MTSITIDALSLRAGFYIDQLRRGECVDVTAYGVVVATLTRLPAVKTEADRLVPEGAAVVSVAELTRDRFIRLRALREGARIVIGRYGHREAVIAGSVDE